MRRRIIAGNWKMHKTVGEAMDLVKKLAGLVRDVVDVEIVVCPPFTALYPVREVLGGSNIALGAQDVYWEREGAFTGEVSPLMLQDLGCTYVIIGHSERRGYFGERDEDVNRKVKAALAFGLNPIVCVGETLNEREAGKTEDIITSQVRAAMEGIEVSRAPRIVVAYEPVWAIGTGRAATSQDANSVIKLIRATLAGVFNQRAAEEMRIQYGGSVKPGNIKEFLNESDIDGALVGGASLDADQFAEIVKA